MRRLGRKPSEPELASALGVQATGYVQGGFPALDFSMFVQLVSLVHLCVSFCSCSSTDRTFLTNHSAFGVTWSHKQASRNLLSMRVAMYSCVGLQPMYSGCYTSS